MSGLLKSMITVGATPPEPKGESTPESPEDAPEGQEDMLVFLGDFENTKLSAPKRLAALVDLIRLIKE